jgi:hypothetical protein
MHDNVSLFSLFVYFKKSDRVVCFVLPDEFSTLSEISTSFHVAYDKSNIFLNVLAVQGQTQHNDCLLL